MERGSELHVVLDHGIGDVELRRGADDAHAESFIAAAVNKYAANGVFLTGRGAALQADMFDK